MCNEEEIFYLIRNINGFEEILKPGSEKELEELKSELVFKNEYIKDKIDDHVSVNVTYYIVPKKEWDLHHCPLFPVDFP